MRFSLLLVALLGVSACADAPASPAEAASDEASAADEAGPVIEVASAESLVQDLDGLGAETVVLNFWATWCAPCRQEFPEFVHFDNEMDGENVEVRFVSLDNPRDLDAIRTFLAEHDVDEPSYLYTGTGDITRELDLFAPGGIPVTMILDGEGIRQYTHIGLMPYDELVRTVAAVRAGEDPTPTS
ncbi:MAG: TlpA disulfide reductase family protein [Bacteroidota bacterium]